MTPILVEGGTASQPDSRRVVVVTPNPAVDVTYQVPRQLIGETVRVSSVARRAGGKGINVARVLATLGLPAVNVLPAGGGAGLWLTDRLRDEGLEALAVPIEGETRTTVAVVDSLSHPTLFAEPGPPLDPNNWADLAEAVRAAAEPGGYVVVAGSQPVGASPADMHQMVATARAAGARILVDTSGPALLAAAEAGADILKANETEVTEATAAPDLDTGIKALLAAGARLVVVSRGSRGLLGCDGGARVTQAAVAGVTGNPTGAGDAATAGLIAALCQQADLAGALRWAAIVGAAAVRQPLAGQIDTTDLDVLSLQLCGVPFRAALLSENV